LAGYVARLAKIRNAYRIFVEKLFGKCPIERVRWEEFIIMTDIRETECEVDETNSELFPVAG